MQKKTKGCTGLCHSDRAFETRYPGGETYFFNKEGGMYVHKRWSMVARPKKHSNTKFNASRVILKTNRKVKYPEEEEWATDQLNLYWNTGIPISMEYMMQLPHQHVVHGKLFYAMLKYSEALAQKTQAMVETCCSKIKFHISGGIHISKDTGGLAPFGKSWSRLGSCDIQVRKMPSINQCE